MSAFDTFTATTAPLVERAPEERTITGEELLFPGVAGSAGVLVTERTALQLSALAAVVNVLSTDVAVLPLNVYRRRPDGGRDRMADDPRDELLCLSPDGGQRTAICWRQSWMVHALLYGNGYAEIQRKGNGMPAALHLLSPDQTHSALESGTGRLIYRINGGAKSIPAENVLHLAGFGFDGLNGFPLVRLLQQAIGVGLAEEGYTADFYANGSEPGGTIEVPQKLGRDGRKNLREAWEEKHRGYGQRHRVAVLEQGASFKNTATDPERAQLVESRRFQAIEVARPWRVPPHKYGDYSQSHLANIEASNLDYLMTALMCWLVAIEQQCHLKLFTKAERLAGYYVEHNVNALLRGDILSRFEAYGRALADGWLNRDEVRAKENLAPIGEEEGGAKYLVQLNQTTLDQIGEAPAGQSGGGVEPPATDILDTKEARGLRGLRYNPNHDTKTGQFAEGSHKGGGGGGGGGGLSDQDRADTNALVGDAKAAGMDVKIGSGKPADDQQARALAKATDTGKHAVVVTETPKLETVKRGDVTTYRFGDQGGELANTSAKTYPDPRSNGRWVSSQKSGEFEPALTSFKTQRQATRASRGFMKDEQVQHTETRTVATKTVAKAVKDTLGNYDMNKPPAKQWKVRFKVLTP